MKRIVSALLSVLLVFSCMSTAFAASFPDLVGDWAAEEIEYMISKGILNGYPEDGTFKPINEVKRAEFIKMICETFGLTETTDINFSDVTPDKWYYPYIQMAAAQGFLLNYGSKLNPEGKLTREEAAALLVRYLDLDDDKKVAVSKYPDYSEISLNYRDYVLQASYAGIFGGRENGKFDPKATLQRREAAAILYRTAGTIYEGNATGTDIDAGEDNAVITGSNATITAAQIPGRLIISEGADRGAITFNSCTIGEMIVRGTSTIVLGEGTTVESIVMDTDTTSYTSVTLTGGSSIDKAELRSATRITVGSRTSIDTLTVNKTAEGSLVKGTGTLQNAEINAYKFAADNVPTSYKIASGVSATFAGVTYSGDSTSVSNTGFSAVPVTSATSSVVYMTVSPAVKGTVYYYFTPSGTAPSKTTFDSLYETAGAKGSFAVSANVEKETNVGNTVNVGVYPYVVVMLRDSSGNAYNPVVIANKSSTGFSAAPTVSTSGSYHYLAYTPLSSGTLYYFYTNNSTALSVSSFTSTYNAGTTSYKGTISVTANQSASSPTLVSTRVSEYKYVALLLEDEKGEAYQPVVIPTSETQEALGTGFISEPTTAIVSGGIQLTFVAAQTGMIQYYFTTSNVAPTSAQFDSNIAIISTELSGSNTVSGGLQVSSTIGSSTVAASYPYLVIRFSSGTAKYTPVVVSTSGVTIDLTNTGFSAIPVVSAVAGYYSISISTQTSAAVYFYLTNSESVPNATVFNTNYLNATSQYLSSKIGGQLVSSGYIQSNHQTTIPVSNSNGYKYMALMVAANNQSYNQGYNQGYGQVYPQYNTTSGYTPVVVPLPDGSANVQRTADVFTMGPSYYQFTSEAHQVEFTTNRDGTIYYYYTDYKDDIVASEIVGEILFGNAAGYSGATPVRAGQEGFFTQYVNPTNYPDYVALIFVDANNNAYEPLFITTDASSASNMNITGFNGTTTVQRSSTTANPTINCNTSQSGNIYYYFTSTNTAPVDATAFMAAYNSSAAVYLRGMISVGIGRSSVELTSTYSNANYPYVVLMFQLTNGGTGGYRKPLVVTISGSGAAGAATSEAFSGTPYLSGNTLYYMPAVTGTMYYSYTDSNSLEEWMEPIKMLQTMGSLGALNGSTTAMTTASEISAYICYINGGGSIGVSTSYYNQSMTVNLNGSKYLVLWVVTSVGSMTTPAFVPTNGSSYTGSGTTSGTTNNSLTGFAQTPTYDYYSGRITYSPAYAGTVRYVFTNSNAAITTQEQFTNLYNAYSTSAGSQYAYAGTAGYITKPSAYYGTFSYVYIQLTSSSGTPYLPVCIQVG